MKDGNDFSEEIEIKRRARQGCMLSPVLFNMYVLYVFSLDLQKKLDENSKERYGMPFALIES